MQLSESVNELAGDRDKAMLSLLRGAFRFPGGETAIELEDENVRSVCVSHWRDEKREEYELANTPADLSRKLRELPEGDCLLRTHYTSPRSGSRFQPDLLVELFDEAGRIVAIYHDRWLKDSVGPGKSEAYVVHRDASLARFDCASVYWIRVTKNGNKTLQPRLVAR